MTSRTSFFVRKRVCAVVLALSLVPVTACTAGGTTPGATASSESSSPTAPPPPTPTPTPTPTASYRPADASGRAQNVPVPVLPDAAKAETKEGLEAFARYWYSTVTYAYEAGDVSALEAASGPSCDSCARVREVVQGWHSEGRWLAGGKLVVEGVQSRFVETGRAEYQVLIQVRQESLSYYRADKTLDEKTEPGPAVGDIMVATYESGKWKAATVEHLEKSK
ncbi:DUF6318 family protein [Arthrobacter sp. AL08]|uniref:DUF6318 family protein n=1 Tax=Micrococcaceae TaxID=1268 RepID=UPI00249B999D|nr:MULTISPECIES: DUF6318 family protein [Micrococcaceae]MDI3242163.1 DUF6318 family protein [Arthrobacter sp. AL05]MDI3278232.1 DUF6318 family protein [Arthrobacter sp. AL08]MDJ0353244.1 DUF6318 family protein [Pseudarthrobacter sp. PH31-O2]